MKAGYGISEHSDNPKKQSNFSQEQNLQNRSPAKGDIDAKMNKVQNLASSNPQAFGNNG